MTGTDLCAECGGPAPHRMLCAQCLPQYEAAIIDDECTCVSCRSDCAGIVPCERPAAIGREVGDG